MEGNNASSFVVGAESRSVGERVWNVAETAGSERRQKIDTTINRVLGLPEAAGALAKIGTEAVKAKAGEIKDKAIDLKERTQEKIAEIQERLVDRYESARDGLISRVEDFRNKITNKVNLLKGRAVNAGIEAGYKIEERIAKVFVLPAEIKETKAGKFEAVAVGAEKTKEETEAQHFAEMNGLSEVQQKALEEFLANQASQKEMLEKTHEDVRAEMTKSIEAAKAKSLELKEESFQSLVD
jgi:HPt (histidine-containing phosphotransfer) domain-containing protein